MNLDFPIVRIRRQPERSIFGPNPATVAALGQQTAGDHLANLFGRKVFGSNAGGTSWGILQLALTLHSSYHGLPYNHDSVFPGQRAFGRR